MLAVVGPALDGWLDGCSDTNGKLNGHKSNFDPSLI
jgi:hypothetical protein